MKHIFTFALLLCSLASYSQNGSELNLLEEEHHNHFGIATGPVAEYAWSPNDAHAMIGLHIGFGF